MSEKLKVKYWKTKDLIGADYNPRQITEKQFSDLCDSIKRFGFQDPIIVNVNKERHGIIVAGHQRRKAAEHLGLDELPCVEVDLTLEREREFNIRHNKNTGSFDMDALANFFDPEELKEYGFEDYELGVEGFDFDEEEKTEGVEDDFNEEIPIEPKTVLGDLYELNGHRVHCASSTEIDAVEKLMDGKKADMVFTDPPYNVAFNGRSGKHDVILNDNLSKSDFEDFIVGFISILKYLKPKAYYIWCNWNFYGILHSQIEYKTCIVWAKNVFGLGRGYRHQHEFCLFNGKIDEGINNESDLWEIKKDSNYVHPTQKPIDLSLRALSNHKESNIIVDLFLGSGSTLIGCEHKKRKCYGQELDPKYCDVIVKRWVKYMKENKKEYSVKRNGVDITKEDWLIE